MCDPRPAAAGDCISIRDIVTLVLEDRAEFSADALPFRHVGDAARDVTERALAVTAWRIQLQLIEARSDDVVLRVAATRTLRDPSTAAARELVNAVRNTPWAPGIQALLVELALAFADVVLAPPSDQQ